MALVRAASLLGYSELVAELGADPGALLRQAGIPSGAVADPDAFIGFRNTVIAVEMAARATGATDFGRQLARRQGLDILGPVGAAARTAPTVRAALTAIVDHMAVYSPAMAISLHPDIGRERAKVDYRILVDNLPDHRQAVELALGVSLNTWRLLAGPGFSPLTVHLPHRAMGPRGDYTRYFGARLREDEPCAAFTIRRSELDRPITADGTVHRTLMAYLQSITPPPTEGVVPQVRSMASQLMGTGALDIAVVARQLAMHPRTLQRRLAAAGTTFDRLVDEVRRESTRRYLRDTDMPMGQLAGVLGYSEQSVLTRSCRRWFGASPVALRRSLRA
ncbi:AraC family transcriptional regulator [Mycobacterium sp. TJFP1]